MLGLCAKAFIHSLALSRFGSSKADFQIWGGEGYREEAVSWKQCGWKDSSSFDCHECVLCDVRCSELICIEASYRWVARVNMYCMDVLFSTSA